MQRPNIVFLFCDQQRFDTLGVNGQPLDMTPNLDALAFEGVNFLHAYTPQPVCGPCAFLLTVGIVCNRNRVFCEWNFVTREAANASQVTS